MALQAITAALAATNTITRRLYVFNCLNKVYMALQAITAALAATNSLKLYFPSQEGNSWLYITIT